MSFNEYYKKWKKDNNINDNVNNNTQSTPNTQSSFSNYYEQWRENNNVTHKTQSSFSKYYENWKTNKERQQSKNEEVNDEPKENVINQMSFLSPEKQKELEEKLAQLKNQSQSVNLNQKEITNRTADNKIEVPKVQIANKQYEEQKQNKQVESIDKLVKDYKAKEKAEEINKNIQKGGADAVNATLEDTINNFSEGILGEIAGIANVPIMLGAGAIDGVEKIIPNSNSDIKNSLLNESNRIGNKFTKYTNANQYIKNDVIKTIGNISNTIGNMVPSIVSNIFLPGSGTVAQGLSVGGKTAQDSVNNEKDNIGQSIIKGAGYGTASGLIEKLTGGNVLGKGSLDDFATNFIGNKISSKLGQKIASKGYEFLGEELEEFLENQVDHAIDLAVEGKGVTKEEWLNEFNETNKNTFLTTAVLNLLGLGGNTYKEIQNNHNIDTNTKQAVSDIEKAIKENNLGGKEQLEQFINNKLENSNSNLQQQSIQNKPVLPINMLDQEQKKVTQNGNIEQRLQELKSIDTSEMGLLERSKINKEIRALEGGYSSIEEYDIAEKQKIQEAKQEYKEIQKERQKNKLMQENISAYQMEHRPTKNGVGYDITSTESIGKDIYTNPENYFDMSKKYNQESYNAIKQIQGKPNAEIIVYRASPVNELNNGDWISLSKEYATMEAQKENVQVNEFKVKAKDIQWAGDDINEFGYFPENLANNQETLYNSINESESGINGEIQREGMAGISEQYGTRIQQEGQSKQNYTKSEYEQWEQSIKPNEYITNEQKQIKDNIKTKYGKDIVFFNESNGNYNAGTSLKNNDTIYINPSECEAFGIQRTVLHEVIESNIASYREVSNDIIQPAIQKIIEDPNFEKQKQEFWKDQLGEIPSDYAIAKDILCDRFAEMETGEKLDYNNVLSQQTNMTIDYSVENFNQELEKSSSIDLPKNQTIQEEIRPTRHEIIQNNREIARENIKNISTWKDKKSGIKYQLETMERNMYDIIPDKAEAKRINDTYFEPIHTSEAEKQKFINNYNDKIKQYDLNKYESEAVQFLGEKKYNPDFYKGSQEDISVRDEIAKRIDKNIENGKINQEKVNNAIEEFRTIYDELFELENKTLRENGYKEKPYRKGYFPHFVDYTPQTRTEKVLDKLGFKIDKRSLPTDIAGITEQFIPGKTWNKSTLERKTNKTNYNALKGFDTYISQAADNIFHTEDIQKLRGLENEIRYQYSDKGVQERINNILNDETLFEEEKQALLDGILEQTENPMPNLVTELRRYTNALANKKSEADRSIEQSAGRKIYSTVNAIENRFGANAVGLNIGSAITNFIPITQAYSQVSTKNMGRAIIDTVKSYANNDGFVDKSAFLTSRLNQSEKLYKTSLEKISDKTSFLFNAIDEVTSNIVVRGKYLENIQNGMSESEAIKNADQFARNVIADRSKGALPTKFEEKNPVTKMFTQFQLEVNNQYRYMFKDIPRDLAEKGLGAMALAFFKMFVGAWVYNEASEKITGRKPAFSPIDLVLSSYKTITDKDIKTYNKLTSIGNEVMEQLPFVGSLVGGGRVPVNGAIPNAGNLTKAGIGLATGEMESNKAMNTIGKELAKPLYYLLPPFGGGQIKKSVEGINAVSKGGSYGVDEKGQETLQFPVENANIGDYIKAGVFGKYALPKAKEYVEEDFKSLSAKDTKLYKNSKIDYDIFKEYIADRDEKVNNKAKSKEAKAKLIKNLPVSTEQKWEIYKSDIFSTAERSDGTTEKTEYEKLLKQGFSKSTLIQWYDINKIEGKKDEEGKTIEGSSQGQKALAIMKLNVSEEQKNKMLSLITTSKNPETVSTLSRLDKTEKAYTDYFSLNKSDTFFQVNISRDDMQDIQDLGINQDEFMKFAQNVENIKSEKDKNGKTIAGSKKKAVANYINSLNLSSGEKAILFAKAGYPDKGYKQTIYNYINGLNLSATRKKEIWDSLGYK